MGWLLRLVTGSPLVEGPDKKRKGLKGPRPEKVNGERMVALRHCISWLAYALDRLMQFVLLIYRIRPCSSNLSLAVSFHTLYIFRVIIRRLQRLRRHNTIQNDNRISGAPFTKRPQERWQS